MATKKTSKKATNKKNEVSLSKKGGKNHISDIGTFGDISFQIKQSEKKVKLLGISNISQSSTATFEEHQRNAKKSLLEFIGPGLDTISFNVYANAQFGIKPQKIKQQLYSYLKKGTPNYFVMGGKKIGDNRWVITSLQSDYTVIYVDGRVSAITFNVQLQEYANPISKSKNKKVSKKSTSTSKKKTSSDNTVKKTSYEKYTVKEDDTLWGLADKFYDDGSKYTKIYNANKDVIPNPNTLKAGWVIKIPK